MKIKSDSLLLKAIYYNDIAIFLTTIIMLFVLGFYIFNDINNQVPEALKISASNIKISYNMLVNERKNSLYKIVISNELKERVEKIDKTMAIFLNTPAAQYYQYFTNKQLLRTYTDALIKDFHKELIEKNESDYYFNDAISFVKKNGEIIAESLGNSSVKYSLEFSKKIKKELEKINISGYFIEETLNDKLLRVIYKYDIDRYLVVTTILDSEFISYLKKYSGLVEDLKLFLINGTKYLIGELGKEKFDIIDDIDQKELIKNTCILRKKKIAEKYYNLAICNLELGNSTPLLVGIALTRMDIIKLKWSYYLVAFLTLVIVLLLASTIFGYLYYKLFTPLIQLSEISDEISNGNLDVKFKVKGIGEIRSLIVSLKKMIKTIKLNQKDLEIQNEKLKEHLMKLNILEKLLINIRLEVDIDKAIYYILSAATSEIGLNFARGIYFEYSEEKDSLIGKLSSTNIKIIDESNELYKYSSGLKLQTESLDKIIKLISIKYEEDTILKESIESNKIIYYNERGFNFNFGNELLIGLGINNFIILPIRNNEKVYGCILLDNSSTNRIIEKDDYELINLLKINLSIFLDNKDLEKNKIQQEKKLTIDRLSRKILLEIQEPLKESSDILIKHFRDKEKINEEDLNKLEERITQIATISSILYDYSEDKLYLKEKIDINLVINNVLEQLNHIVKNKNIFISKLINHKGFIFANRYKLEKVFFNIFRNSIEAIGDNDGRINIITRNIAKMVEIRIIDNGIGIKKEDIKSIFEPFVSINKSSSGLGLTIAKKILDEHNADIKIKSLYKEGTDIKIIFNIYEEEK
ncbi:signal transduction histidine kinase [Hypnocyclicus thermotrophus]|uniref:histidine kinase n=1 Tax=Hypnocyclicus thermotrophus TaxID=1627895 RepID=A0AA46DZ44_9FUSO|nr:sensor histidine kinase [Hypnocyclicus thermotrophus]TDT71391.1 signal transduction histidine kinase [Hypnocyclicus thermotrophus]